MIANFEEFWFKKQLFDDFNGLAASPLKIHENYMPYLKNPSYF